MKPSAIVFSLLTAAVAWIAPEAQAQDKSTDTLAGLVKLLQATDDADLQLDVLKGMHDALKDQRTIRMPDGWPQLQGKLAKSSNAEVRSLAADLSVLFGDPKALEAARQTLTDANATAEARQKALETLARAHDANLATILHQLLEEPKLRGAALRALASYDDPKTPTVILKRYASFTAQEKRFAISTLISRLAYARELMVAVDKESVPRSDLSADLIRQLRSFHDADLERQITRAWGVLRNTPEDKLAQIAKYKALLTDPKSPVSDPSNGRALFARTCQQCHTLFGVGGKIGPDLTGSNRADLDYLLQNVVDPNAIVGKDYLVTNIATTDGEVLSGIVVREDDNTLTLQTPTEIITLPRREIQSRRLSELSMMPEGLLQALPDSDVRDLVSYLRSTTQVPMLARPDNLDAFFNRRDLSGWNGNLDLWKVEDGAIVGKTSGLKKNEFLRSQMLLADFRLIVRVKLVPNRENSGIQFRSEPAADGEVKGYQADIGEGWWGKLYEELGRGLIWDKHADSFVNLNDWNTYEILAVGDRVRTALNGHLCVDVTDPQGAHRGIIALQLHAGGALEVQFKDFKLELNPPFTLSTVK